MKNSPVLSVWQTSVVSRSWLTLRMEAQASELHAGGGVVLMSCSEQQMAFEVGAISGNFIEPDAAGS